MATNSHTGEIEPFGITTVLADGEVLPRLAEAVGPRLQQPEHHEEQARRRTAPPRSGRTAA